jgi:phenylpropionate dioxygenase-like ring-hydroxylating dioxygenase large terminal subunit
MWRIRLRKSNRAPNKFAAISLHTRRNYCVISQQGLSRYKLDCHSNFKRNTMIPNQWYIILESNEVKKGKPVGFTRMGEKIVAWCDSQGNLSVMGDQCPHRGVALSAGKLKGECIQCPFHGFEYDTSGNCKLVPANGRSAEPPKALHVKTERISASAVV